MLIRIRRMLVVLLLCAALLLTNALLVVTGRVQHLACQAPDCPLLAPLRRCRAARPHGEPTPES
jgi:hypothetical protein